MNLAQHHQKKNFILFLIFLYISICGNMHASQIDQSEEEFISAKDKIFQDSFKTLKESKYFAFMIKNLKNLKVYKINPNQLAKRFSPASTFKIPLALMGFDSGILIDENNPVWDYHENYKVPIKSWQNKHSPSSWIKYSVVWYSQELAIQMGLKKFGDYVKKFHYGNEDIRGSEKKGHYLIQDAVFVSFAGLINSWLGSTLKISANEQINFLEKLVKNRLPVSQKSMNLTKKIIFREIIDSRISLFGKTGTAQYDLSDNHQIRILWFVGWLDYKGCSYLFASNRIMNVRKESPYLPFADQIRDYLIQNLSHFQLD